MKTLLALHSSGRVTRSITRRLTRRFLERLRSTGDFAIVERDLTASPPPVVNEPWIAGAFRPEAERTAADREALRVSDALIDELQAADLIVIGVPLYNFGMPAQLKAYIDQIVRVNRTFALEPGAPEPYRGLLSPKPVVIITSAGDGDLQRGGPLQHLNFLEPHLSWVLTFLGLGDPTWIRVGYEEFGDDRLRLALGAAEAAVDGLADAWVRQTAPAEPATA